MKKIFIIPLVLFSLTYSCSSNNDNVNAQEESSNIEAKTVKTDLSTKEVYNLLNDKNYQFIDVREEFEYKESHIKGVKLIPLGTLQNSLNSLDKNGNYVMICRSGARSMKALGILKSNGFANVYNMKGGMLDWESNNLPVEK